MTGATFAALPSNVDDRAEDLISGLDHIRRCLGLDFALAHGDHLPREFAVFDVQAAAGNRGAVRAGLHALHAGGEYGTDGHGTPGCLDGVSQQEACHPRGKGTHAHRSSIETPCFS